MNRTGTIKLLYKDEVIAFCEYFGPQSRIKVLDTWKAVYGKKFNECAIQYRPDIIDRSDRKTYDTSKRVGEKKPAFSI